jgi:hypothetical protein
MSKKLINFFSKREVQIFFIFFILIAIFTKTGTTTWNDDSRMAMIESLVERGTFNIDNTTFQKGDTVYINCKYHPKRVCDHQYSEKPPVLSFFSAGLYFVLNKIFGLNLNPYSLAYYILTLLVIGTSAALLVVFFYKSLGFIKIKEKYRILITLGLGTGTLILPYSAVFNNHIVSASLLFISFYIILKLKFSKNPNLKTNMFFMGLLISLATVVEYPVGVFLILFFIYILTTEKLRPFIAYFILGLIGPLTFHFILNYIIFGSFKPAYWLRGAYNYPGSPWQGINANRLAEPRWRNPIRIIIGDYGLFSFNPILLIPFLYLLTVLFDKKEPLIKEAWIIFLGIFSIFYFYITKYHAEYGGGYGFRFLIILIPLIMFFASTFFKKNKSKILFYAFYINFCLSVIIAIKGLILPNAGWSHRGIDNIQYIFYISFYLFLLIITLIIVKTTKIIIKKIKLNTNN